MRLRLYSSIGKEVPNLVSVQAEDLDFLPTVLVCPIKQGIPETIVRAHFVWQGIAYTAIRPFANWYAPSGAMRSVRLECWTR